MTTRALRKLSLLTLLLLLWPAAPAAAQIARTFVSITGNDANTCSNVLTPCRTFAGGITQVDAGGEVIILSTGSYAGSTITKSVSINVPSGIVAFTAQPITINAPGSVVSLRGLTLTALPTSTVGIDNQASFLLTIDSCALDGWPTAINQPGAGTLIVRDTTITNAGYGLFIGGLGEAPLVNVENCKFINNGTGLRALAGSSVAVRHSVIAGGVYGIQSFSNVGPLSTVTVEDCLISYVSLSGIRSEGAFSVVNAGNSTVVNCFKGFEILSSGVLNTFGSNQLHGNTTDVSGSTTPLPKS